MTQYTVFLKEQIQDPEYGKELTDVFRFYRVSDAKKFIKKHMLLYNGSSITKIWANGDWENLGEIKLSVSNKHCVANTRMKKANY
uniref:hypothetical protein n=1 Tax=Prevotella sp. TaxID=59823 RepID=UPI00402A2C05